MISQKEGRYLPWFGIVCVINESTFETFPFNVFEPSNNIAFHVLLTVFEIYEA